MPSEVHRFQFELYDDETDEMLDSGYGAFKDFVFLAHGASKQRGHWMRIESGGRLKPTRIKAELIP